MRIISSETGMLMKKNKNTTKGFTLVEILVVLFIFTVILSFAVIKTDFYYTDKMKTEQFAQKLIASIKLAKQEAILQHTTLRLTIENNQYGFERLYKKKEGFYWESIEKDSLLGKKPLPAISIQSTAVLEIYPNGRITPFEIFLKDNHKVITIFGDNNGNIGIKHDHTP